MTPAELLDEVLVQPRHAHTPLADTRIIERPGWFQLMTPSLRQGGLNEVALSVLTEGEADAVIDATLAQYASLGVRFRWCVTPESRPIDLGARLERRGLIRSETRAMARATAASLSDPKVDVQQVDLDDVERFTRVMALGWAMDAGPLRAVNDAMLASSTHRLFLATIDGEPVGTAASVSLPRSVYLIGAVVLPAHRQRGVYRALVNHRVNDGFERGLELATSHARADTSAPVLERLGFRDVLRYDMYFNR